MNLQVPLIHTVFHSNMCTDCNKSPVPQLQHNPFYSVSSLEDYCISNDSKDVLCTI